MSGDAAVSTDGTSDRDVALDEMRRIVNQLADTDIVWLLVVLLIEKKVISQAEYHGLIDARVSRGGPKIDVDDPAFLQLYRERMAAWRRLADEE